MEKSHHPNIFTATSKKVLPTTGFAENGTGMSASRSEKSEKSSSEKETKYCTVYASIMKNHVIQKITDYEKIHSNLPKCFGMYFKCIFAEK